MKTRSWAAEWASSRPVGDVHEETAEIVFSKKLNT